MSPEFFAGVVLGSVTGSATKAITAPIDALAESWKERVKGRLDRTAEIARRKQRRDGSPEMNERVAMKAFMEASGNDDAVVADYLGGIIAASTGNNDFATPVVAQIGRLSAEQLKLHYLIYREIHRLWPPGQPVNLHLEPDAARAGIRVPIQDLIAALGTTATQRTVGNVAVLVRENLLHNTWSFREEKAHGFSLSVRPSGNGALLFLWGQGFDSPLGTPLVDGSLEIELLPEVADTPNAVLLQPPGQLDAPC